MLPGCFPLNEQKTGLYNAITQWEGLQKGMAEVKQTLISLVVVMMAAGILAGMVLYTVSVMRDIETRILTGMISVTQEAAEEDIYSLQSR